MASVLRSLSRAALLLSLFAAGCTPTCESVCKKMRKCDVSPRLAQTECEEACIRQADFYQSEADRDRFEDYQAHKRCLKQATCEEIHDGECYDEDIYVF